MFRGTLRNILYLRCGFAMWKIMTAIASLLTNAFKTVQPSAKDKADTYRRADAHQGYLTQDFTL